MKRRTWISALVLTLTTGASMSAHALTLAPYTPQALQAAQAAGRPVALHFHADWCPTCRAQQKVLTSWRDDPALDLTVLVVDYDQERALRRSLRVQTQSTLIVYRGAVETARLAGETAPEPLRAALLSAMGGR